jgi:hypothetical protein
MVYAEWSPTTYYVIGDIVQYLANVYEAIANNNNKDPPTFPAFWTQIGGTGAVSAITAGAGISVNNALPTNPVVSYNLTSADSRLTITNGIGTQRILNNNCVASVSAGTGLTSTGTPTTGITLAMANVGTAGTYAYPTSVSTDAQGRVSAITGGFPPVQAIATGPGITITGPASTPTINNVGLLGLTSGNAGTGITIGGTSTNPTITNAGLLGLTSANAGTNITIGGTPTAPVINATAGGGYSIINTPLGQMWSDTNQNVDNNGAYNIETSVNLTLPSTWSNNKNAFLVILSVSMTQTLTTTTGSPLATPVQETITFGFGDIANTYYPITPITITNNTGMTANGATYTNTYSASYVVIAPTISATSVWASIYATNNIPFASGWTNYVANIGPTPTGVKGWCSVIPLS